MRLPFNSNQLYNLALFQSNLIILFMSLNRKRLYSSFNDDKQPIIQVRKKVSQKMMTEYRENEKEKVSSFYYKAGVDKGSKIERFIEKRYGKTMEQLTEQVNNLKRINRGLQDQIIYLKNEYENERKKNHQYTQKLEVQYSKQMYYSGKNPNSHMISGIKHQYQKLKNSYDLKSAQLQKIKKKPAYTNLQENLVYIQALEDQNKSLIEKWKRIQNLKTEYSHFYENNFENNLLKIQNRHKRNHSQISSLLVEKQQNEKKKISDSLSMNNKQLFLGVLANQQESLKFAKSLIHNLNQKNNQLLQKIALFDEKISFLQKGLIEKDNASYHYKKLYKGLIKQNKEKTVAYENLKNQFDEYKLITTKTMNQIKQGESAKLEVEKNIFLKNITDKELLIDKLNKQIRFLTTLLSYWKPLDQITREFKSQNIELQSQVDLFSKNQHNNSYTKNQVSQLITDKNKNQAIEQIYSAEKDKKDKKQIIIQKNTQNRTVNLAKSQGMNSDKSKNRLPKSCLKRQSDTATKCKRVQLSDIKSIGDFMKYRLIGNNLQIEEAKKLIDFKGVSGTEDFQFKLQYINMKELQEILSRSPFSLSQQESFLVSRYIVEDSSSPYVYCDQNNEIDRVIVKSILKSLVGDYLIIDANEIKAKWNKLNQNIGDNIRKALRSLAPQGFISITKLSQLLNGLSIEIEESVQEWIIGQMSLSSQSLEKLSYSQLISN